MSYGLSPQKRVEVLAEWERQKAEYRAEVAREEEAKDRLLTVAEAASRRRVSQQTIREAIRTGRLPALELSPPGTHALRRVYGIRAGDLQEYHAEVAPFYNLVDYDRSEVAEMNRQGLYTINQAAKMIGLSRTRIIYLIKRGRVLTVQKRVRYIHKATIQQMIDERAMKNLDLL